MSSPIFAAVVAKNKLVAIGSTDDDMPELERLARKVGGTVMRLLGRSAAPIAAPTRQVCCVWADADGSCRIHDRHQIGKPQVRRNHDDDDYDAGDDALWDGYWDRNLGRWVYASELTKPAPTPPQTNPGGARQRERGVRDFKAALPRRSEWWLGRAAEVRAALPAIKGSTGIAWPHQELHKEMTDTAHTSRVHETLRGQGFGEHSWREGAVRANGVYDPGVLKAVFLAGGPGSGKSYQSEQLFGVPKTSAIVTSSACGLKLVNPDPYFEHYMRQQGIDPKMLGQLSAEDNYRVCEAPDSPRLHAKRVNQAWLKSWLAGRVGLVIDGTGDDLAKITKQKLELEALGYDTFMVFVNTSLPVAQERNAKRARSLAPALVEHIWTEVQKNIGGFQQLFDRSFAVVDASVPGPTPTAVIKAVDRFLREPIRNHIGKQWIAGELAKKDRR